MVASRWAFQGSPSSPTPPRKGYSKAEISPRRIAKNLLWHGSMRFAGNRYHHHRHQQRAWRSHGSGRLRSPSAERVALPNEFRWRNLCSSKLKEWTNLNAWLFARGATKQNKTLRRSRWQANQRINKLIRHGRSPNSLAQISSVHEMSKQSVRWFDRGVSITCHETPPDLLVLLWSD